MVRQHGRRVRTVGGALAAALVMTLLTWVAAPPAAAAAWNQGTVYLPYDPPSNFGSACVSREIRLAAGQYRWKKFYVKQGYPTLPFELTTRIQLRSGRYLWKDCLGLDTHNQSSGQYLHCSWLDELATPGGAVRRCQTAGVWEPSGEYYNSPGYYDFGSGLDREGP